MSERVHYDPDAQPNMGDDRCTTVWVDFTPGEGLKVDGYDSTSWPSRDYAWHIHVAVDQIEQLRESLGAKTGEDTLEVFVGRFADWDYSQWLGISTWLKEHGIEYSISSRSDDN